MADSKRLVSGIGDLFKKAGLTGYEPALTKLGEQLDAYDAWLKAEIIPRSRTEARLPPELYAVYLRNFGVNDPPEAVLRAALISFGEIRNEMNALAPLIARSHKLPANSDYRAVLRTLKKQQLKNAEILPLYTQRLAVLEDITRREHVVTLPQRKAKIRLASEAESAMQPAPHMDAPRLIGNTGEYGEFVLPLATPGAPGQKDLRTDDFTFDAATWTLTVHEARPGHELQFTRMLENGVSIARAVFAFNSANVEGWALYAEAEMKPYLPLEGQLASLQHRMLRAARAFLDPMVNLGQITPEDARRVLMEDVVMSEGMAKQEVDRYTFRAPGQATLLLRGLPVDARDAAAGRACPRRAPGPPAFPRLHPRPGAAAAGPAAARGDGGVRARGEGARRGERTGSEDEDQLTERPTGASAAGPHFRRNGSTADWNASGASRCGACPTPGISTRVQFGIFFAAARESAG